MVCLDNHLVAVVRQVFGCELMPIHPLLWNIMQQSIRVLSFVLHSLGLGFPRQSGLSQQADGGALTYNKVLEDLEKGRD